MRMPGNLVGGGTGQKVEVAFEKSIVKSLVETMATFPDSAYTTACGIHNGVFFQCIPYTTASPKYNRTVNLETKTVSTAGSLTFNAGYVEGGYVNGFIVAGGGFNWDSNSDVSVVNKIDCTTKTVSTAPNLNTPTLREYVAETEDEIVYCEGGNVYFRNQICGINPVTNTRMIYTNSTMATQFPSGCYKDSVIYLAGGAIDGGSVSKVIRKIDLSTNTVSNVTNFSIGAYRSGGIVSYDTFLVVCGYSVGSTLSKNIRTIDLTTLTKNETGTVSTARYDTVMAEINGRVFCSGGATANGAENLIKITDEIDPVVFTSHVIDAALPEGKTWTRAIPYKGNLIFGTGDYTKTIVRLAVNGIGTIEISPLILSDGQINGNKFNCDIVLSHDCIIGSTQYAAGSKINLESGTVIELLNVGSVSTEVGKYILKKGEYAI